MLSNFNIFIKIYSEIWNVYCFHIGLQTRYSSTYKYKFFYFNISHYDYAHVIVVWVYATWCNIAVFSVSPKRKPCL